MAVEYPTLVSVIQTDTFEEWRVKTNSMIAHTEAAAQNVGNLNFLNTDGQSTIVDAINEVDAHADTNTANIGNMTKIDGKIIRSTIVDTLNAAVECVTIRIRFNTNNIRICSKRNGIFSNWSNLYQYIKYSDASINQLRRWFER